MNNNKTIQINTLCSGIDYFGNLYSDNDVHYTSTEYHKTCPKCNSHNIHALGADCGGWDWILQQCKDCCYIFVYGWVE